MFNKYLPRYTVLKHTGVTWEGHVVTCLPLQALRAGTPTWGPALLWVSLDPKQRFVEDLGMLFSSLLCLTNEMISSCFFCVPPEPSISRGQRCPIAIG